MFKEEIIGHKFILSFKTNEINSKVSESLETVLKNASGKFSLGIDLRNVDEVSNEFLSLLKKYSNKNKISLFNVDNGILAILSKMRYLSFVELWMNKEDYKKSRNSLKMRHLRLV